MNFCRHGGSRWGRAGRLLRAPAGHQKCDQKYASHPAGRWCCGQGRRTVKPVTGDGQTRRYFRRLRRAAIAIRHDHGKMANQKETRRPLALNQSNESIQIPAPLPDKNFQPTLANSRGKMIINDHALLVEWSRYTTPHHGTSRLAPECLCLFQNVVQQGILVRRHTVSSLAGIGTCMQALHLKY